MIYKKGVALGDLQCSVMATLTSITDAVINISTSAQIAFITETTELKHSKILLRLLPKLLNYNLAYNNYKLLYQMVLNISHILKITIWQ